MTPDTHQTKVIFRADKDGEITALFPALAGTNDVATCTCYAHLGQHGSAFLDYIRSTRPATPEQYAPLLAELRRIGYLPKVAKRATRADRIQRGRCRKTSPRRNRQSHLPAMTRPTDQQPADKDAKMKTDYSTAEGQIRLMRESVGQPTDFPNARKSANPFKAGDILDFKDFNLRHYTRRFEYLREGKPEGGHAVIVIRNLATNQKSEWLARDFIVAGK